MKNIKILFSSFTIAFAILGLTKALSFEISQPIMFTCLAITMFITSKEYKIQNDKISANLFLGLGIFLIVVTVYNVLVWIIRR